MTGRRDIAQALLERSAASPESLRRAYLTFRRAAPAEAEEVIEEAEVSARRKNSSHPFVIHSAGPYMRRGPAPTHYRFAPQPDDYYSFASENEPEARAPPLWQFLSRIVRAAVRVTRLATQMLTSVHGGMENRRK